MSTVSNVASTGYSSTSASSTSKETSDLKKEYEDKIAKLDEKLTKAEEALASATSSKKSNTSSSSSNSDMLSLFGASSSSGQTGFDFFFGAKSTLSNLSIVNKARQGIENRARTLTSEIKMDKMRGIDTSGKEEALSNLTENLTLMNDNLSNNVDKALTTDKETEKEYKPIITTIKDQLAETQKTLDAESKKRLDEAKKKYGITDEAEDVEEA